MPSLQHGRARARRRLPLAVRVLSVPVVIVIVVAGIWITGGKLTNDFALAMWLTVGWMALAGLAALGVAVKRRELAVPVLGAYMLAAAAAGIYLGRSIFLDDVVNENVATAAEPAPRQERAGPAQAPPQPRNVLLARGEFESLAHSATGVATAIRLADGGRVLTLTEFEVDNGPDLRVYLVAGPARTEDEVDDFRDLGALKGNEGDQQYEVPDDVDLDGYSTVVVWCRAFSVAFARAPLRPPS